MNEITVNSFGKINLSLNVTGVREDGYHTIETVMQKISLADSVTVKWLPGGGAADGALDGAAGSAAGSATDGGAAGDAAGGTEISVKSNRPFLPNDERNIAYKAAALMLRRFGGPQGLHNQREARENAASAGGRIEIYLQKRIPVSAGLAGGSGNGAAVLSALNKLWKLNLTVRQMCALGEELGADVPFCVLTQNSGFGCALGTGTGAELSVVRSRFKRFIVLAKPSFGISTKEAYAAMDDCPRKESADTTALMKALIDGDEKNVYADMINQFESYVLPKYAEVREIKERMRTEARAEKTLMTGSGPTVFGTFAGATQAKEGCRIMRQAGYEAYWARML